jgi:thiopeptide-type bacteriocin biosynthesis protein
LATAEPASTGPRPLSDHRASGFFVLRTPLLPVAAHLRLGDAIKGAAAASDVAAATSEGRRRARRRLSDALDDRALRGAIAVASPSTDDAIEAWQSDPTERRGRKTERALMRYVARAACRSTPFGLFAGVSVGQIGARTALVLPGRERYASATRISLAWATEMAGQLADRPELRDGLRYRANPTLYRLPGRWRYVARRAEAGRWIHSLRELRDRPALSVVLEGAAQGASPAVLAELLVDHGKGSEDQVRTYVRELIDRQLLIAELAPPVTGGEPVGELLAALESTPGGQTAAGALRGARQAVQELDHTGLETRPHQYRAVRAALRELHGEELHSQPLSVELHKRATDLTVGPALIDELARGIEVLRRWAPAPDDPLEEFRAAFQRRYGWHEVPLPEAIDENAGVGLDAVLSAARPRPPESQERDRLLFAKLDTALRRGDREIVVEADERELDPPPLPPSFVVGASVAASSSAAIDRGEFRVWLKYASGPDAVGTLARFCHGDPELHARVRAHLREEEALDPDAVHAEIAHLPQLELGAALHRPVLRDVEIDYLGPSGAPHDRRLRLADLLVSVADDRVLLRSRRDGRWVVPRLASALNVDLRLAPALRLLMLIEGQGGADLSWSWGSLRWAPYHPRVRSGRTILALAHWRLGRDDLEPLARGSGAERFRAVARLRARRDLPRLVAVIDTATESDNVLPVDLDTTAGVDMLLGLVRGREDVDLLEVFPDPAELCVEGPEGRFTHELIVPFLARAPRRREPARPAVAAGAGAGAGLRRSFPPGSEWLYLKLYGGSAGADGLLRDYVGPLCERLVGEGVVTRWFFIRYLDPELHLRVRLQGDPSALLESALPLIGELSEGLLERRLIWRATLDTLEREVERYGGAAGVALCEAWFHADSEAAVAALAAEHREGDGLERRWRVALLAADAGLGAFGLDPLAKVEAMRSARRDLAEASGSPDPRSFAERYGERHHAERRELQHALHAAREGSARGPFQAYRERAGRFEEIADALLGAHADGRLTRSPTDIALSLLHMRINRLLRLGSLEPEVRLYDALERLYSSELARAGSGAARD